MVKKTSEKGIEMIKQFEGLRVHAYLDAAGVCTIGYGHTKNVKPGDVITEYGAESLLKEDLTTFERHVNSYAEKYSWSQNEFDAMVSFAYNIGNINGVTAKGTRTKEEIANAMVKYCKATVNGKKVELKGLVYRRKREREIFLNGYAVTELISDPYKIALEVWDGKWGNGAERKEKLENTGVNYEEVQRIVNLKPIAEDVVKGKWGNGEERISRLASAGYNYGEVQTLVNHILSRKK